VVDLGGKRYVLHGGHLPDRVGDDRTRWGRQCGGRRNLSTGDLVQTPDHEHDHVPWALPRGARPRPVGPGPPTPHAAGGPGAARAARARPELPAAVGRSALQLLLVGLAGGGPWRPQRLARGVRLLTRGGPVQRWAGPVVSCGAGRASRRGPWPGLPGGSPRPSTASGACRDGAGPPSGPRAGPPARGMPSGAAAPAAGAGRTGSAPSGRTVRPVRLPV